MKAPFIDIAYTGKPVNDTQAIPSRRRSSMKARLVAAAVCGLLMTQVAQAAEIKLLAPGMPSVST